MDGYSNGSGKAQGRKVTADAGIKDSTTSKRRAEIIVAAVIIAILVLAGILVMPSLVGCSSALQTTVEDSTNSAQTATINDPIEVNIKIDGTEGGLDDEFDGTVEIERGGTVYDALTATGAKLSVKPSMGMGTYVAGIDGLMEKDKAASSGWLYYIDGTRGSKACDQCTLSGGETVLWIWKLDAISEG